MPAPGEQEALLDEGAQHEDEDVASLLDVNSESGDSDFWKEVAEKENLYDEECRADDKAKFHQKRTREQAEVPLSVLRRLENRNTTSPEKKRSKFALTDGLEQDLPALAMVCSWTPGGAR